MIRLRIEPSVQTWERAKRLLSLSRRMLEVSLPTVWAGEPRVPVTVRVLREGEPSASYLATMTSDSTLTTLAIFSHHAPKTQWFLRGLIYQTVIAQAYEYTEPRMGITRWPTISETANAFLLNVTEGSGGGGPSTVDARLTAGATVESAWSERDAVIVERMDDGQWRVAGYGRTSEQGLVSIDLRVTTSGTIYAVALDDYGVRFVANLPVSVGDRVRPVVFTGWVYEITEAGQLPSAEPEWWAAVGENPSRPLGTARAVARRYFQPIAHGPVPVEVI